MSYAVILNMKKMNYNVVYFTISSHKCKLFFPCRFLYLILDQSCMSGLDSNLYQGRENLPLHLPSSCMRSPLKPMESMTPFSHMGNQKMALLKLTTKFPHKDPRGLYLQGFMRKLRQSCSVRSFLIGLILPRSSEWRDIRVCLNWQLKKRCSLCCPHHDWEFL